MAGFFEALLKFLAEFTWKRLFALLFIVAAVLVLFSLYERYTSSFRLSRLQKSAELLKTLEEIEAKGKSNDPTLEASKNALIAQAAEAIQSKPLSLEFVPATLKLSMNSLWKLLAGAAMWLVIALFQLRSKKSRQGALGMLLMSGICGLFGMFIPDIWWPWFHLLIYPWLFVLAVLLALSPVLYIVAKRATKKAQVES